MTGVQFVVYVVAAETSILYTVVAKFSETIAEISKEVLHVIIWILPIWRWSVAERGVHGEV